MTTNKKLTITIPSFGMTSTGGEKMIISIANNLSKRGHIIYLVFTGKKKGIWYPISNKVNIIQIPFSLKQRTIKEQSEALVTKINKIAGAMPESDIYLANWVETIMPCMANNNKGKTVFFAQGNEVFKHNIKGLLFSKAISQLAYRLNVPIVVPSNHLKKFIKTNFNNSSTVIPPFVDSKIYKPKKRKKSDKIRILFPGDFENENKGFIFLVKALKKISSFDFELHTASQAKPAGKYNFPIIANNPKTEKQLADIYNNCDLTVHLSEEEGFGLTLLESMACGNICLTTETGGNNDFAVNNKNCILVDRDADAIAKSIKMIVNDLDSYQKRLSKNATNTAKEYTEKRMMDAFEKLFLEVAN